MSGINFSNSQVTIQGDIVNVEGNQINLGAAVAPEVATVIAAIVASQPPETIPSALTQLVEASGDQPELTETMVADAVAERLGEPDNAQRGRLREVLARMGESATTSVVAQGVVLGLRAVLGL